MENYYVLIMIDNTHIDILDNRVEVIGIFSSKENAEFKINSLPSQVSNNFNNSNYMSSFFQIQGPFAINKPISNIVIPNPVSISVPIPIPGPIPIPDKIPIPDPVPHPDIFNPDIFKHSGHCSSKYFSSRYFPQ